MRKIVAFFLGFFLVFTLGYATLHPSFFLLMDWLVPLLGTPISTALTVIYLLLGDPIQFAALGALWAGVAFLGGAIIRRRIGAPITMLIVFLAFLPALGLSAYGVLRRVSELGAAVGGGNPLDLLPPLPSGLTVVTLFEAPIIGEIIKAVIPLIEESSSQGPGMNIVFKVISPLFVDFAEKTIIVALAALLGAETGKRLEPILRLWFRRLRFGSGVKPLTEPGVPMSFHNLITLAFTLILLVLAAFSPRPNVNGGSEGDFFTEDLLGFVDRKGRGYIGYIFVDSGMSIGGIDVNSPAAEGLIASVLISQEGIREALKDLDYLTGGFDPETILEVIPPTIIVAAYLEVPKDVAEQRADTISLAFSNSLGIEIHMLLSFEIPRSGGNGPQMPPLSIVVYQSPTNLEEMAGKFMGQITEHGGLADLINEAFTNKRLIPEEDPKSADGTIFLMGFANLGPILQYVTSEGILPILDGRMNATDLLEKVRPLLEEPFGFSGGVSYWDHGVEPAEGEYGFNLMELLGVDEASLSQDSDLSLVVLAGPNQTAPGENESRPILRIVSSLPTDDPEMGSFIEALSKMGLMTVVPAGVTIPPQALMLSIPGEIDMPLVVTVTKEASPTVAQPKGEVKVTVTVRNEDMRTMSNVQLSDGSTLEGYPNSASLESGSTSESWAEIGPGESRALTYTIKLGEAGVYSLMPAEVGYTHSDNQYTESSGRVEVRVARKDPVSFTVYSVVELWATAADLLNILTGGKGSIILTGSTLLIFAVLFFFEYRSHRKRALV